MLAWRGNPAVNDPGHSRSVPPHQRREALRRADDRTRAGSYGMRRSRPAASWPWQPVSAEADPACPRSPAGSRLRGPSRGGAKKRRSNCALSSSTLYGGKPSPAPARAHCGVYLSTRTPSAGWVRSRRTGHSDARQAGAPGAPRERDRPAGGSSRRGLFCLRYSLDQLQCEMVIIGDD